MNKTIWLIAIISLATLSGVQAHFREVTCGSGAIGGLCHEKELQDEFNDVIHRLQEIEGEEWATPEDINDLWAELGNIQTELDRQAWVDKMHTLKIKLNKIKIKKLNRYVRNNAEAWAKDTDTTDGNGVDLEDLGNILVDNKKFFFRFAYDSFVDYLRTIFVTHEQLEEERLRLDKIEAYALYSNPTSCDIALITAARRAERVIFDNGFIAEPGANGCFMLG